MECSFYWYLTIFFASLATVITLYFKQAFQYWEKRNVPHTPPTFPFGNCGECFANISLYTILKKHYHKFKSEGKRFAGFYMFTQPVCTIMDLKLVKRILTKDFHHFVDRVFYYNEEDDPLSAHLFGLEGSRWKTLRGKLTPTFTSGKMKAMFSTLVNVGYQLEEVIGKLTTDKQPLDIKDILARYSTDVIGSCAFGLDCNSLKDPQAEFRMYGKKIFQFSPLDNLKMFFAMTFPNAARKLHIRFIKKDISDFFMGAIKSTIKYREEGKGVRPDFLQMLVEMKNANSELEALSLDEIAAQAYLFFAAGFETSSTAMTFCLYELSKLTELQEQLRAEINQVMKKYDGKLTYNGIKEMKLLERVVDETLRKKPPVALLSRVCTKPYKLPDTDVTVEVGTSVFISIYGIHHDPEYFPDPEKFDPDRFTEEAKLNRPSQTFLPFGEGPRNCIGLRFGLMQVKVALCLILKNFRITLNEKTEEPLMIDPSSLTLSSKGPIWLNSEKV